MTRHMARSLIGHVLTSPQETAAGTSSADCRPKTPNQQPQQLQPPFSSLFYFRQRAAVGSSPSAQV